LENRNGLFIMRKKKKVTGIMKNLLILLTVLLLCACDDLFEYHPF
jgi:hypothetical protein